MNADKIDNIILVTLSLGMMMTSLIGSFVVSGNIIDLIYILIVVGSIIWYFVIDYQEKKQQKADNDETNILL